jgi:putative two-component system response regulator
MPEHCILIVDDEPLIIETMSEILRAEGYDCLGVTLASQAIDVLQEYSFDLVITDYNMPDMDGVKLMKKIRGYLPDVPFIFTSGYLDRKEAIKAGASDHLKKPFEASRLKNSIEKILSPHLVKPISPPT